MVHARMIKKWKKGSKSLGKSWKKSSEAIGKSWR
jgi:hypothetical protein